MDAGFSRIGRDAIMCMESRENYKATLDPKIYRRLFTSFPQGRSVGNIASVKPLGKAPTTMLGCRG